MQRVAGVKHAGRGKDDHRTGILDVRSIPGLNDALGIGLVDKIVDANFDVLEIEDVLLVECRLNLLIGPRDEQRIVGVDLFREARSEIDRHVDIHPFEVRLQKNAQFLRTSDGEDRHEHLAAMSDAFDYLGHEISFACSTRITYGRTVGGLSDQDVRSASIDVSRAEMPIGRGIEITGVDQRLLAHANMEHRRAQYVSGVVGFDLEISIDLHRLSQADRSDFLHAVLDVFGSVRPLLGRFVGGDLTKVLLE